MQGQLTLFDMSVPKMPSEYIGKNKAWGGITKNIPREWTDEEIAWCIDLRNKGYTTEQIAESIGREKGCVGIKLKRITKTHDTYNESHLTEKYRTNDAFLNYLKPNEVLDVYSGKKHYWSDKCKCVSNDKNKEFEATYHMDSLKLLCQEYLKGNKYDLVDLDPFGSAFDCFDLAIKIARKGIIITYGEMGHKRWKRTDFVKYTYGISGIEDFTIEKLIEKTKQIANHNHKSLSVWKICSWQNISRVYFMIDKFKITEQWEKEEKRICSCCGKEMSSGYVISDGSEYYCSDDCLNYYYSAEEYEKLCEQGLAYWTMWETE